MADINRQLQELNVGNILRFYTLEIPNVATPLRFHCNGVTETYNPATDTLDQSNEMSWLGQVYTLVGIKTDGMVVSGDGSVNSPTLTVANRIGDTDMALSALCRMYNNLSGAKLTMHLTSLESYTNGTNQYKTQIWWVAHKNSETPSAIEFALDMPANFNKKKIPTRVIDDLCAWAKRGQYRGEDCGYTGTRYFDENGNPVASISLDSCGGTCADCELRFGKGASLPFGGFLINYMRR